MLRVIRKLDQFERAKGLRLLGESYGYIQKELGISKGTLYSWFSDKKWSSEIKYTLVKMNLEKSRIHMKRMNEIRLQQKLTRDNNFRMEARTQYETNRINPLFISGISLYWGEGEKANKGRVSIINSDVAMLKLAIRFFREIMKIPESKLRAALFIYKDIDPIQALNFWSSEINLPKEQFIKTQVLPSRSLLTKRKVTNGICNIYFTSVEGITKIREWLSLLANDNRL